MRFVPVCDGALVDSGTGQVTCSGTWLVNIDASPIPGAFDISVLDPELLFGYFGAGFMVVATACLIGIAFAVLMNAIKGDEK